MSKAEQFPEDSNPAMLSWDVFEVLFRIFSVTETSEKAKMHADIVYWIHSKNLDNN